MTPHSISQAGLALIQDYEGFRAEPTQLPDGNWVIGFGHVRIGEAGGTVTATEAADLLALDLAPVERSVNAKVSVALTQSQFDALVSFAFSVGIEAWEQSQVLRRVNTSAFVAAACAMDAWRKSDVSGELEIIDALVRRRAAEKAMFLKDVAHDAAPSVFMRAKLDHAASVLGAPINYAPAPVVGSIAVIQAKPEPTQRLSEILKSEPATEALLLTQVVPTTEIEEEGEIVTAHARPVARPLDRARQAARRAYEEQQASERKQKSFRFPRISFLRTAENFGLAALLLFGFALIAIGVSTLLTGQGDAIDIFGASAFTAPGIAAVLMAGYGLWRGPTPKTVKI